MPNQHAFIHSGNERFPRLAATPPAPPPGPMIGGDEGADPFDFDRVRVQSRTRAQDLLAGLCVSEGVLDVAEELTFSKQELPPLPGEAKVSGAEKPVTIVAHIGFLATRP
jgi:hypothetical protein